MFLVEEEPRPPLPADFSLGLSVPIADNNKINADASAPPFPKKVFCDEIWPHELSRRAYSTVTTVLQFVVPFVIIAFCYIKVCGELKKRAKQKPGAKSARKEKLERERSRRTNRMLIAMVVIFGCCWLPLNVHNLLIDFWQVASNWPYVR